MLHFAIITITLALCWYSTAVWAERISGRLKKWHVVFFWIGFLSDATGTITMTILSKGYLIDIHGISGPVALLLMLIHASWATVVIKRRNEKLITSFHKFSMFVWMIWLIPYITGVIMHMK
jgi:uncharacterized repeat protein (TIGR03987 family)